MLADFLDCIKRNWCLLQWETERSGGLIAGFTFRAWEFQRWSNANKSRLSIIRRGELLGLKVGEGNRKLSTMDMLE